jgi:hypothetical protein
LEAAGQIRETTCVKSQQLFANVAFVKPGSSLAYFHEAKIYCCLGTHKSASHDVCIDTLRFLIGPYGLIK